jgi:hypothetical protein
VLCDIGGTVLERRGGGMTENIAIYCLKAASELNTEMCEECPLYGQTGADHCCEDALHVAIKALEELQQYREIGTVEECRAAMEKQTAKKVKSISQVKDGDSYVGLIGRCPCCGDILEEDTVYCDCGQRLDWGDEE